MRVKQWRAANAAKGILQRRTDPTWGMRQVSWWLLDEHNRRHAMRYREMKVLDSWPDL